MPEQDYWESFFDVSNILKVLSINNTIKNIAEIGCGYGTFTIPIAKNISGKVFAFDIDKNMISVTNNKLNILKINNVELCKKDVLEQGTGLANESVDYVVLFNILHNKKPSDFLNEAYRILKPSGKIGIIHWRSDIQTPRGPDLSIRPKPNEILSNVNLKLFKILISHTILEPYHFGILLQKV